MRDRLAGSSCGSGPHLQARRSSGKGTSGAALGCAPRRGGGTGRRLGVSAWCCCSCIGGGGGGCWFRSERKLPGSDDPDAERPVGFSALVQEF